MGLLCAGLRHCCLREGFLPSGGFRTILNLSDEAITALRQSLDKPGLLGVVSEGFPELLDRVVEAAVKIHKRVGGPDASQQLFPGHHLTRMLQQDSQNLKWLFLEPDL